MIKPIIADVTLCLPSSSDLLLAAPINIWKPPKTNIKKRIIPAIGKTKLLTALEIRVPGSARLSSPPAILRGFSLFKSF